MASSSPPPAVLCDGMNLQGTGRAGPAADLLPHRADGLVDHRDQRSAQLR